MPGELYSIFCFRTRPLSLDPKPSPSFNKPHSNGLTEMRQSAARHHQVSLLVFQDSTLMKGFHGDLYPFPETGVLRIFRGYEGLHVQGSEVHCTKYVQGKEPALIRRASILWWIPSVKVAFWTPRPFLPSHSPTIHTNSPAKKAKRYPSTKGCFVTTSPPSSACQSCGLGPLSPMKPSSSMNPSPLISKPGAGARSRRGSPKARLALPYCQAAGSPYVEPPPSNSDYKG